MVNQINSVAFGRLWIWKLNCLTGPLIYLSLLRRNRIWNYFNSHGRLRSFWPYDCQLLTKMFDLEQAEEIESIIVANENIFNMWEHYRELTNTRKNMSSRHQVLYILFRIQKSTKYLFVILLNLKNFWTSTLWISWKMICVHLL